MDNKINNIELVNNDDYLELKERTSLFSKTRKKSIYIFFKCVKCGKDTRMSLHSFEIEPFKCRGCHIVDGRIEKYGSLENYTQTVKNSCIKTCQEKYGVDNVFQTDWCKEKIKKTCQDHFGVSSSLAVKEIHDKGVKASRSKQANDKRVATLIKKYGVTNALNLAKHRDFSNAKQRTYETIIKNWGSVENWSKNIVEKAKKTNLKKFGVEFYTQCEQYRQTAHRKYTYKNITFDSSWELAFYIFYTDLGKSVERCPCRFEYFVNNKKHYYIPDFKMDNKIYEIKGPHLLTKNGLVNPYAKELNDEKYKCMINNNVTILEEKDLNPILSYINTKYGRYYLQSFRNQNLDSKI